MPYSIQYLQEVMVRSAGLASGAGRQGAQGTHEKATPMTTTIWNMPVIRPRTSLGVISET